MALSPRRAPTRRPQSEGRPSRAREVACAPVLQRWEDEQPGLGGLFCAARAIKRSCRSGIVALGAVGVMTEDGLRALFPPLE